ncbi:MAG: inner membrane protein YpjD [Chthoniobacterales bacterium]
MDRQLLILSTICYGIAVTRTVIGIRAGVFRPGRFNFIAIAFGFLLQTAFLSLRGHQLHRCPLTNLFEVFVFLAWSLALVYMLVGPAYRLSLMGAFTAPLVFVLQGFALVAPIDVAHAPAAAPNSWLEFHASISIIAYGAFALACVAGLMYLAQERQLKNHRPFGAFHDLPPLSDLFAAITRLLWCGFALYTTGLASGFFVDQPLPRVKVICAFVVWAVYAAVLLGRHLRQLAPKRVAVLCIVAFSAAVSVLWAINFTGQSLPPQ